MDWFERITGFREGPWHETRARLSVEGPSLVSDASPARRRIGRFELVELGELRRRVGGAAGAVAAAGGLRTRVQAIVGDARALHAEPAFARATFQVASQFNLLEMVGPHVTPEQGVTRYAHDRTQGPACAIAAGAGTIFRNYLVPVPGGAGEGVHIGQVATRQLDGLAPLGRALAGELGLEVQALWTMRNGYALCTRSGLAATAALLSRGTEPARDALRARLAVGVQEDVEVTDVAAGGAPRLVTQVFCSALPVAYGDVEAPAWEPLARLVLEAAYEATLLVAVAQRLRGASAAVLLTRLGGGAFGNHDAWIDDAIVRGLGTVAEAGLDVHLVSHGSPHPGLEHIAALWGG
jgi:hypothetical protein